MAENDKVSTAEPIRNFGPLADKALSEPSTLTKNCRDRLFLMSTEECARLKRRSRDVIRPGRSTDEERVAIAAATVPTEDSALDDELAGWTP